MEDVNQNIGFLSATPPKYPEEERIVDTLLATVFSRSISKSMKYPVRGYCACADHFWRFAPDCVKETQ